MTAEDRRPSVLAPLAARYRHWLALSDSQVAHDRDEAAEDVRAMQIVLRMERDRPPTWPDALALAGTGAAAICLDPRSEPGGEWHRAIADYCAGHIRKVVRRARGAQWEATAELPGLTLAVGDTQLRVLLPGRVAGLDKRVSKLQVGGTDVPDEAGWPAPAVPGLLVWLLGEPPMTLGKAMAQVGHAGMIAAALLADDAAALSAWTDAGLPVRAARADPSRWVALQAAATDPTRGWSAERVLAVRDAGFTEVAPGTVTVIGSWT